MKLSFVFELLLIFILIAFAASAIIDSRSLQKSRKSSSVKKHVKKSHTRQENGANKYCSCSFRLCNCCREFTTPIASLQGPGCASLEYLNGDRLALTMSFGERTLANTTISTRKPQPICMPLPGRVSKFCGRVYNIGRKGDEFNACLGLELQSLNKVEAALRVSCFRFGSKGLRLEPAQPLPVLPTKEDEEDEDEDDDDDYYSDDSSDYESVNYGAFSVLDDDFIGEYWQQGIAESSTNKKKVSKVTKPPVKRLTSAKPVKLVARPPVRSTNPKPIVTRNSVKTQIVKQPVKLQQYTVSVEQVPTGTQQPTSTVEPSEAVTLAQSTLKYPNNASEQLNVTETAILTTEATSISTLLDSVNISSTEQQIVENTTDGYSSTSQSPNEKLISSIATTEIQPTTTLQPSTITPDEDEEDEDDDDDEDPISEVVEEVLGEDETTESTTTRLTTVNDKDLITTTIVSTKKKTGKDVLDDIVDGMMDTVEDDDDDEDADERDEDENEEEDEDDEDDEE